ncbi:gastrokine-1-like [Erpetoichthys calabaricus]|uniref:gastrokine-1-like n=1 Tax=Erpetoichthys calabaricus TaxID=27687 RepID=UPI002233F2D2|nr:gastrokine-1-like [Erpetoichthys calabaricus]
MLKIIAVVALLGACLSLGLADEGASLTDHDKSGKPVHHSLVINKQEQTATVNLGAGKNSYTAILDYKTGIVAYRSFSQKSCFISRMNRATIPSLEKLSSAMESRKNKQGPPPPSVQYNISPDPIKDQSNLGAPVQALCQGLPSYWAQEQVGNMFFIGIGACANLNILFLFDVGLCGHVDAY